MVSLTPFGDHVYLTWEELGAYVSHRCTKCKQKGYTDGWNGRPKRVCQCIYRQIALWCRQQCTKFDDFMRAPQRYKASYHYPERDYRADFGLVIYRVLSRQQRAIWDGFEKGLPHHQIAGLLGVDKGTLFHEWYRALHYVGKACVERGLWPMRRYLAKHEEPIQPWQPSTPPNPKSLYWAYFRHRQFITRHAPVSDRLGTHQAD